MIGYLKGNILSARDGIVLIECNGIGFSVICTEQLFDRISVLKTGEMYTYLDVKEDSMTLYGFDSFEEKEMFVKLTSVSGVGPKTGIMILSGMSLKDIAFAIAGSDIYSLSKIKGIGKKTAERIILELRESIQKVDLPAEPKKTQQKLTPLEEDSVIALMSLGFSRSVSEEAVKKAVSGGADTVETILTLALQSMK